MAVLHADSIGDIVKTTLNELGRMRWTQIATTLQEYVAMSRLLKRNKVQVDEGKGIQWNLQHTTTGAAVRTGLFHVHSPSVGDTMVNASAPWRYVTTKWSVDRREPKMNRGASKVVDLVKTRRVAAWIDMAVILETDFWTKPTDSTDTEKAFGVPYWIVKNNSEGFNGGNPSGFTSGAGGLSSSTYTRWKNWTAQYTNVSKEDFVRKARNAATKTGFKPPIDNPNYERDRTRGYYTNYDVIQKLEELVEQQNDNLGNDVASKDGATIFRRQPVIWVPYLDDDTTDPFFGINWSVFAPVCMQGEYMREGEPMVAATQPSVATTYVDLAYNYVCYDRRQNFVIALNT